MLEGGLHHSRPPRKISAPLTEGKEQEWPPHSQIYGPQQAGKNPVNISANPASVRSYRVIGVSPRQTHSCRPSPRRPRAAGEVTVTPRGCGNCGPGHSRLQWGAARAPLRTRVGSATGKAWAALGGVQGVLGIWTCMEGIGSVMSRWGAF